MMALITMPALAQKGAFLEFSAGGGWSTITYNLLRAPMGLQPSQNGSYGLQFHAGFGYMFNRYVGLGIGADVSRVGASAGLQGEMRWNDVTDTDGERYNHIATINRWTDRQEIYYVEVPLAFCVRIPTGSKMSVSAEVGVKYAHPFSSGSTYDGNVTHIGQYPAWGLTLQNVPNHGFYTEDVSGKGVMSVRDVWTAFAKVGILVRLCNQCSLMAHVYGNYGLGTAIGNNAGMREFGVRGDSELSKRTHSFIAPAAPLLETNIASGAFRPISVGLEIGVRVHFPTRTRYKCPCRWMKD